MRRQLDAVGDLEHRERQPADYVEMGLERHQSEILRHSDHDTKNHAEDGDVEELFVDLWYATSSLEPL